MFRKAQLGLTILMIMAVFIAIIFSVSIIVIRITMQKIKMDVELLTDFDIKGKAIPAVLISEKELSYMELFGRSFAGMDAKREIQDLVALLKKIYGNSYVFSVETPEKIKIGSSAAPGENAESFSAYIPVPGGRGNAKVEMIIW